MPQRSQMRFVPAAAALIGALAAPALVPASAQAQAPLQAPPAAPSSFAGIIERVAPAVVSIDVSRQAPPRPPLAQLFPGFPFPLPQPGAPGAPEARPEMRAAGSGFFISADGYIVTNNHVVENATRITVTLNDGRELQARLIGRDPLTDLAVIKVEGSRFPFVRFETGARPRVGDWVIAVGNPFGLGGTATAGIVSASGRDIGEAYVDYLQIDAPINRGNSGGPTFDAYGRVIGVNTAIFSPNGGSIGIGFAIPAEIAAPITRELIASGEVRRGYIGAMVQNITPEIADSLGIGGRKGALVAEVTPGGPADRAGLRPGDALLALNGEPLSSSADLTRRVGQAREGESLRLEVLREGRRQTVVVRSGLRPPETEPVAAGPARDAATLGLSLRPLDELTRRRHGLPPGQRGLVIERVDPESDAAQKGVRPGDVLEQVGGRTVASTAEVEAAVAEARRLGRPAVLVRIAREGRSLFLPLALPER